jgi:DNA-binding phage protein
MPILRERKVWKRDKPKTRRVQDEHLDEAEEANVIRAIRFLGERYGGLSPLAREMGAARTTVTRAVGRLRRISPALALRVAKTAGVSLAAVLSGEWPEAGMCPMCGR